MRDRVQRSTEKRLFKYYHWRDLPRSQHPKFMHYLFGPLELPEVERLSLAPTVDARLVERVVQYYRMTRDSSVQEPDTIWGAIQSQQRRFLEAMESGDLDAVAAFLGNLLKDKLLQGIGGAEALTLYDRSGRYRPRFFQLRTVDMLFNLAEAAGATRAPNREQMSIADRFRYFSQDLEGVIAAVEDKLGFSIEIPEFGNAPAMRVGARRLSYDLLQHAYTALRLRQLGATPDSVVLEIGGGFGAAALMAWRAGVRDYAIIDLPYVSALQFGYLGSVLGGDSVEAYGEFDLWGAWSKKIKMLPTQAIDEIETKSVDFVINCDSMPEIPEPAALHYIEQMKRICRGNFLSINHETGRPHPDGRPQGRVADLVDQIGGVRRLHRSIYWMRPGYVEEIYAFD